MIRKLKEDPAGLAAQRMLGPQEEGWGGGGGGMSTERDGDRERRGHAVGFVSAPAHA